MAGRRLSREPGLLASQLESILKSNGAVIRAPFSVVWGRNVPVAAVVYMLVKHFVKGRYRVIVDPTCGRENYQFRDILPILEHWGIEYRACDKRPDNWSGRVCDVFNPDTLPEGDAWFYDPPYVPFQREDQRGDDYGISGEGVEAVRRFYSAAVFRGFERRGARLIVVKGMDFYYPTTSNKLYLFLHDILDIPGGWRPTGVLVYRYYHRNTALYNIRLANMMEKRGVRRIQIVHTYYVVLERDS